MAVTITPVNTGTSAGDGTGDPAKTAFDKVNTNEAALKAAVDAALPLAGGTLTDTLYIEGAFPSIQSSTALDNAGSSQILLRKARGSTGAETAVLSSDKLFNITGSGYGATGFGVGVLKIKAIATENWTDLAQGCKLTIENAANGGVSTTVNLTIDQNGDITVETGDLIIGTAGKGISLNGPMILSGSGSPEGSVTAPVGSLYLRSDGGAGTAHYAKESGTGNTGWVAK